MSRFVLQMAGMTGTGKTTLASAIANRTGAIRIDKDEIMASLIRAGVEPAKAGGVAYETGYDLARSILRGPHSVILDNPANFVAIREKTKSIACEAGVPFYIIETIVPDRALIEARIAARQPLHELHPSNLEGVDLNHSRPGTAPLTEQRLVIDTTAPLETYLERSLEYLSR